MTVFGLHLSHEFLTGLAVVALLMCTIAWNRKAISWFDMPDRVPSPERAAPHPVTHFHDWEQEGDFLPPIEPDLAAAWMAFEEARAVAHARRRHLSVVDRRVENELYPGRVPLHEVSASDSANRSARLTPGA
jgi:hypothetical protein